MAQKKPVNILMVDDQPAKLLSYEAVLAGLGENLVRANSGSEALDFLLRHETAVVLVDVCMPELNGFELAQMIRSHPRYEKTAVILVSGVMVEDMDRLKGYDVGAVDYISVPIIPEILRAKVAVFADLYRKTGELERLNQELESRVAQRTAEIVAAAARLRHSEERMRLVLTAAGIEGWTWDIEKREIAWVRSTGDADRALPAERFLAGIHPADRGAVEAAMRDALLRGGDYKVEFRARAADTEPGGAAEEGWWLGRGTVILEQGRPRSIAGIHINISDRKRAEEERARLLRIAEDARLEAERANRLKDEFLATLSHELRTPLNAITGWAHLLLAEDLDAADKHTAVETIHRNALLQARLIADLLDVSRIVSGKLRLDLRRLDMADVIQAALDTVRPQAEAKGIAVEARVKPGAWCLGDTMRLQQVIVNLLSNGIKFSPDHSTISVRLRTQAAGAEIVVTDEGPGIEADFLPHIFERFRQADPSSTRAHQGLGLGLTIVRHLVEMHSGLVRAANRDDRPGAIFTIKLPLCGDAAAGLRAPDEPKPVKTAVWLPSKSALKNLRLLVVDDEADGREIAARLLERSGAEVLVASSAEEAMEILRRERPHILVADIEMPVEDGYGLVRRVRALSPAQGGKTPALALTAYAGALDRARLLQAGFHRHVAKPVNPAELVGELAALAEEAQLLNTAPAAKNGAAKPPRR